MCTDCPKGYYSQRTGLSECYQCPSGFVQASVRSATCLPAIPGEYMNEKGKELALQCGENTFTEATNYSSCRYCPSVGTTFKFNTSTQTIESYNQYN